ncbi:cell wall protein [Actinokineospora bangkokensis]|uniref:Cell wall protein n=1 Tax=Actinokineospora bangkokensis TaxID=1193682 RepID=A0A1Q9LRM2_9PSEU|nr:cell wall protein [Actinokineospora bangkokensis]
MTVDLGRRKFLTRAVLGSAGAVAGATALGSLAPEVALAATGDRVVPAGEVDPDFAEGRVTAISGSLLLVTGSDKVLHRIHLTGGTSVWKLRPTTLDAAAVGDGLYARGVRLPDGTLAADAVWLNIVNLQAHVAAITSDALHLDHAGSRVVGHVVAGTTAAVYNGTPAVRDLSLLQVGRHVQLVGAWRPDTNEVDIATVYASAA